MAQVNGIDVDELRAYVASAARDVEVADCDPVVVARIDSLIVEATGHFNVRRYLGFDAAAGPGYERIAYVVRLKTRGGTLGQLAELHQACE